MCLTGVEREYQQKAGQVWVTATIGDREPADARPCGYREPDDESNSSTSLLAHERHQNPGQKGERHHREQDESLEEVHRVSSMARQEACDRLSEDKPLNERFD